MVREWDSETWGFGPIYEVKVDKNAYSNKLAIYLADKVFPHIPAENLSACKLSITQGFKRSELVIKRWNILKA